MLKKMIPFGLAASMLIPTIASAQTLTTQINSNKTLYVNQIKSRKQTFNDNYGTNKVIKDTINEKLAIVKSLIAQDTDSKTLKAKKNILEAQRDVIRLDIGTLKGINANLTVDWKNDKFYKFNKTYTSLVNDLQGIPPLQTNKIPVLQKLNSDLDKLISLLNN